MGMAITTGIDDFIDLRRKLTVIQKMNTSFLLEIDFIGREKNIIAILKAKFELKSGGSNTIELGRFELKEND